MAGLKLFKRFINKDVKGLLKPKDLIVTQDPEHVRKVRRRVEDVLRKSDANTIIDVARYMGVDTK